MKRPRLRDIPYTPSPPTIETTFFIAEMSSTIPILDLHGNSREEAAIKVDHFLKENAAIGETSVRLLHGKGKGALREMLERYLPKQKNVHAWRQSTRADERDAVIIVLLKNG
jgi:DNA mismatch repair protein MutS2